MSSSERQRIRLASQIGAGLVQHYVRAGQSHLSACTSAMTAPIRYALHLRDLSNTVIVVEHDEDAIRAADHVIDIGPGAGVHGGE